MKSKSTTTLIKVQWFMAVLFILLGLTFQNKIASLFLFLLGAILLPPINNRLPYPEWVNLLLYPIGLLVWSLNLPPQKASVLRGQSATVEREEVKIDSAELAAIAVQQRNEKIKSDIDGSLIPAKYAILEHLRDPDSYDYIEHKADYVGRDGIYIACLVKYRAKNGYGGLNIEKSLVTFDTTMKPLNVVEISEK